MGQGGGNRNNPTGYDDYGHLRNRVGASTLLRITHSTCSDLLQLHGRMFHGEQ